MRSAQREYMKRARIVKGFLERAEYHNKVYISTEEYYAIRTAMKVLDDFAKGKALDDYREGNA